jgi:hypothetical protein
VTVSPNSINPLIFVSEAQCVSYEVRTEFEYIVQKKFSLQRITCFDYELKTFELLMYLTRTLLWDIMPCGSVKVHRSFREIYSSILRIEEQDETGNLQEAGDSDSERVYSSETSVSLYLTTRRCFPESSTLNTGLLESQIQLRKNLLFIGVQIVLYEQSANI